MTRRDFLKGLGLLLLAPAEAGTYLLRGTPARKVPKKLVYGQHYHIREILVSVQPMTRPAPAKIFFLDYNYTRWEGRIVDVPNERSLCQ